MIQFAVVKDEAFSDGLFEGGKIIDLQKGEVLHDIHDSCRTLGKVLSGGLRLSRILSTGREIVLKEFKPGEIYAELIVFTGDNYPGWLIASSDTSVVEAEYTHVLEYLGDKNALISFITSISKKMNHLTNQIEIMSLKSVKQKVAFMLLTEGVVEMSSITFTASVIGCSREALSRALSDMEGAGLIERSGHSIIIADKLSLEEIL